MEFAISQGCQGKKEKKIKSAFSTLPSLFLSPPKYMMRTFMPFGLGLKNVLAINMKAFFYLPLSIAEKTIFARERFLSRGCPAETERDFVRRSVRGKTSGWLTSKVWNEFPLFPFSPSSFFEFGSVDFSRFRGRGGQKKRWENFFFSFGKKKIVCNYAGG